MPPSLFLFYLWDRSPTFLVLPVLVTWRAAFVTMWRAMLSDFDVDILQQPSSIVVFMIFQFFVVVLMMNLIIAIMADSYEMVKEHEIIEALHERAKIIVDMELLCKYTMPPVTLFTYLHCVQIHEVFLSWVPTSMGTTCTS